MQELRCIIDPSWSVAYAKIGDHFNRVVVDGIIQGLLPIARNLGVSTNIEGEGEVFMPNENYMMVPHDATPKEFAEIVESTLNLPEDIAAEVHANNYKLLQHFDRERVAYEYIDLARSLPAGWYQKLETGTLTDSVKQKTETVINTFFREE
jgi:glycosyltransferase involved in cell wall biosynthesis